MNEQSGWEALPPLSLLWPSEQRGWRDSPVVTYKHARTHTTYTHVHVRSHTKKKPHEIQLGSCILLQFFIFVIISWTASAFFPHLLYHQPHSDRPQQWRHGVKLNLTKPKPLPTRGAIGIRALSVNQNPPAPAHRHLPFGPTGRHENGMQI